MIRFLLALLISPNSVHPLGLARSPASRSAATGSGRGSNSGSRKLLVCRYSKVTSEIALRGRVETARAIDRHARWVFPVVFVILTTLCFFR
jgi:hypothetical protein